MMAVESPCPHFTATRRNSSSFSRAHSVQTSVSAALLVACAVRTITVILTIVWEIVAHLELCGCHRSPRLTGSHLKSLYCMSDSPLSPDYPLSAPHTRTCTRTHISSPMCCNNCLPRPPLFPAHSEKMTCV